MTLKQLQYFLAVYEEQSIAKAAETLFVSRPVISRALKDMEGELEFTLFIRSGNGIAPTDQGQELYRALKACEATLQETVQRLREGKRQSVDRQVSLGILNSGGSWYYRQIIQPFMQLHPDVSVNIVGLQVEESLSAVEDGSVDMAIAPILLNQQYNSRIIREHYLYDVEFVLCVPPNVHLSRQDISIEECAMLPMATFDNLPHPQVSMENRILSTRKLDMIYFAVSQGFAFSVLPTELTSERPELFTIPFEPPVRIKTSLLWNDALPHGRAFTLLRSFICGLDLQPLRERFAEAYHLPERSADAAPAEHKPL